jgi:hypothetical protein
MLSIVVLSVAGVGLVGATDEESGDQVRMRGPFQESWVRPEADFGQYSKLYLWEATFEFREGDEERRTATSISTSRGIGTFAVSDESRQKFEELVSETFFKELGRSKVFEIVDEVGPDTLIVKPSLVDIASNVPPRRAGTVDVYLMAVGEATFAFQLVDAETGEVQATVGERRRIQPPSRMHEVSTIPTNSATIWSDVQRWASTVGRDLRKTLEKAHKQASK